jgi:hypothetical protein
MFNLKDHEGKMILITKDVVSGLVSPIVHTQSNYKKRKKVS